MASVALLSWPFLALALFASLGPVRGLIWATMIGYLFLPEKFGFDLPVLPEYNKSTAIAVGILVPTFLFRRRLEDENLRVGDPLFSRLMLSLLVVLCLVPVLTTLTNGAALVNGSNVRPGLGIWDAAATTTETLILFMPCLLGWQVLRRPEHHRELMRAFVILGLAYSLLVLFEIRMSPQLHKWTYGYFPHSWLQHLRGGGFRPLVFTHHGLWLAFVLLSITLAAFALSRDKALPRLFFFLAGLWMLGVLLISRNLGATMLAVMFSPIILFLGLRTQARIAMVIAAMFLAYPALKFVSATPTDKLLSFAASVSPQRAASLQTRLDNETAILDRGLRKPLFGWGSWGRYRILNEEGHDLSITDGAWIIVFGERGWIGYLAYFGFLAAPVLLLGRTARRKKIPPAIAGMSVISAANFVYMIPNSALNPIGLMIFGALAGFAQYDTVESKADTAAADPSDKPKRTTRYTRFPDGVSQRDGHFHRTHARVPPN